MKNVFLFLLPMLLFNACNPEPVQKEQPPPPIDYSVLPPITQEGKNTFGCKVNGEVWVPRVEIFSPVYDKAALFSEKDNSGVGNITCRLLTERQEDFLQIIFGPTYLKTGKFYATVGQSTSALLTQSPRTGPHPSQSYESSDTEAHLNWVNIGFIDTVLNMVSGTFQFTLHNIDKSSDTVSITEGRFDMLYYPE